MGVRLGSKNVIPKYGVNMIDAVWTNVFEPENSLWCNLKLVWQQAILIAQFLKKWDLTILLNPAV